MRKTPVDESQTHRWRECAWPYGLFLALACALLYPALLGQALVPAYYQQHFAPWGEAPRTDEAAPSWNPLMADGMLQHYVWRSFARRAIRSGEIPLWNPYEFCGTPFLANGQSAVLYPPNLIFWLLPTVYAFGISAILHLFLAGSFTYLFGRSIGLRRPSACLSGVVFMLSGFMVTWLALPTFVCSITWLPLTLFSLERHFRCDGQMRWALLFGLAVACAVLAGHFQIAFYVLLMSAAYGLFALAMAVCARGSAGWRRLPGALLGASLGLMATAAQVLPSLELTRYGHRGSLNPTPEAWQFVADRAFLIDHLVTLFVPDYFGNPSKGQYWEQFIRPYQNYAEVCAYVGIATIVLAVVATVAARGPHRAFFAGAAVATLLIAMASPVAKALYFGLPGFAGFAGLARILCLFAFSMAMLAGLGLDRLAEPQQITRKQRQEARDDVRRALIVAGLAAAAAIAAALGRMEARQEDVVPATVWAPQWIRAAGLFLLSLAAVKLRRRREAMLLSLVVLDLLVFGWGYNLSANPAQVMRSSPIIQRLQEEQRHHGPGRILAHTTLWTFGLYPRAVLPPNLPMEFGLYDVQGYDSLFPRWVKEFMRHANSGREPSPSINGNMILLWQHTRGQEGEGVNIPLLEKAQLKWIVTEMRLPEGDKFLHVDQEGAVNLYRIQHSDAPAYARGRLEHPRVNVVTWRPETASDDDVLFVPETYFPGWFSINGRSLWPVGRTDTMFMSAKTASPANPSDVTLTYLPSTFRCGAFISLAAVGLAAGIATYRGLLRRGPSR